MVVASTRDGRRLSHGGRVRPVQPGGPKEQFVIVDDSTVRVDNQKDRLTIPDSRGDRPRVSHSNSEEDRSKATDKDPWGSRLHKSNTAGSGAYKVTSWKPGVEVRLRAQ